MKRSVVILSVVAMVIVCRALSAAVILSEGFNQATIPTGWSLSNATPVTFVTSSTFPVVSPYEGTHFVKFNSYSAASGVRSQLVSPSVSSVGSSDLQVIFAWHRDTDYASSWDRVYVQYSIDGSTWTDVAVYPRTNTVNGWELKTCPLPANATNQPNLRIAFQFVSAYGNNCYLDAVQVKGTAPGDVDPPASFTATAAGTTQINLAWQTNAAGNMVMIASNGVATFGVPTNGISYAAGSPLPGGGIIIYKGSALTYPCTGLTPDTRYYYAAWSVNAVTTYSPAVTANAKTFAPAIDSFPYMQDFNGAWPPAGWSVIDNLSAGGKWDLNTTWSRPNYAGGDGTCADADSDKFGDAMNTELRATFNLSGMTKPVLKFITSYNDYGSADSARTEVSTNGGASWVTLANWTADISPNGPGSNIVLNLQAVAGHPNVILRFWYVSDWDWWWEVDNVFLYDKVPNVYLEPLSQSGVGYPGRAVPYRLTAENASGGPRDFNFTYDSIWPVNGPSSSGTLADGTITGITVSVTVPAAAYAGQACTTTVRAVSTDNIYTNSARLITSCTWVNNIFNESFATWPNGWTNYPIGAPVGGWYRDATYGAAAHGKFAGATNWLVSPPIDLTMQGADALDLSFLFGCTVDMVNVEGVYLSAGSRNPADGAYVRLADIDALAGYWVSHVVSLLPFVGSNPVYIGIAYLGPNDWQLVDQISIIGSKTGINNAMLVGPPTLPIMTSYGSVPAVTGGMSAAGASRQSGPAPYTTAELGFGPTGTVPNDAEWTWFPASFVGFGGTYDLYTAAPQLTIAGPLNYCYRFRRGNAGWVYADLDGSTNGFDLAKAGVVNVNMLPPQGALLRNQTISLDWAFGPSSYANPSNVPPLYYETADDINLPYDAHIKSVRMGGLYWNAGRQGLEQGFWLRIYGNAVTNPGAMLYQQYVPGYACEKLMGVDGLSLNDYLYHVNLSTPFLAQAGNTYWISLQEETRNGTYWSLLDSPDAVRGVDASQRGAADGVWSPVGGGGIDIGMEVYGDVTNAGYIAGTVRNADTLLPLEGALVTITNATYVSGVITISNGTYHTPAPAGTYYLTVTMANYLPATAAGVVVTVGNTTVQDFLLEGSQLYVAPTNIVRSMAVGQITTNALTMTNTGPLAVSFTLSVGNFNASTGAMTLARSIALPPSDGNFPRGTAPMSMLRAPKAAGSGAAAPTMMLSAPPVQAYGFNIYPADPNALIRLMTDNPGGYTTVGTANTGANGFVCGATFLNGDFSQLYALVYADNKLVKVNTANATVTDIAACAPGGSDGWTGMAVDPTTGILYASAFGAVNNLYTINPTTGAATLIGQITNADLVIGIAINAAGQMYGLDLGDYLISINKATGAGTVIGSIGYDANYAQDLAFDVVNNVLYVAAYNNTTGLAELRVADTTTGNTTLIGAFSASDLEVDGFATMTYAGKRWAQVATNAGAIAAGGVGSVDVIFDSNIVSNLGTYTASLVIDGTFVNPLAPVPLTMILGAGPIISAPAMLNFGDVMIGETCGINMVVGNIGVGDLVGATTVTSPFAVVGAAGYTIAAGASVTQNLIFVPPLEIAYSNTAVLTGGGGATVTLLGVGIPEPALLLGVLGAALLARRRG
jgi:hypothetical protein